MAHSSRGLVERLAFVTTLGYGEGGDARARLGIRTAGPTKVITDLCILEPDPVTRELTVTSLHPGVDREQVTAATGWPVRFADVVTDTPAPSARELDVLRTLRAATADAHKAS
jgi:glutaconate CoA-transferase subunit B